VFDLAHVVTPAGGEAMPASVATSFSVESGSFFDAVPPADAYLLEAILHDWPDDRCVQILRSCARSLTPGGAVLVVETVLGRPGHEVDAAFCDLTMLVFPEGRADRAAVRDALRRRRAPTEPDPRHDVPYSIVEAKSASPEGCAHHTTTGVPGSGRGQCPHERAKCKGRRRRTVPTAAGR
jgi:O-methyltransferase domain